MCDMDFFSISLAFNFVTPVCISKTSVAAKTEAARILKEVTNHLELCLPLAIFGDQYLLVQGVLLLDVGCE